MPLFWPDHISTDIFLKEYWQKKPLLIRNGFVKNIDFISPDELAGLACEEEIESRIITGDHKSNNWTLRHGPFAESDFSCLPESAWTLLVQDVDKYFPDAAAFLAHFDFIPQWRIDDLMISYAEDQGSVGPHTDSYDVFLVQLQGERLWKLSDQQVNDDDLLEDCDVRVLKEFVSSHEWLMQPGDVLYLPPGIPHWGIAKGPCLTGSVGFVSPSAPQMLASMASFLDELPGNRPFYTDPDNISIDGPAAELTPAALQQAVTMLHSLIDSQPQEMMRWFGQLVTESKPNLVMDIAPEQALSTDEFVQLQARCGLRRNPMVRTCFAHQTDQLWFFVNAESYRFAVDTLPLIEALSSSAPLPAGRLTSWLNRADTREQLVTFFNLGYLIEDDAE